jgi:hypothetical protein
MLPKVNQRRTNVCKKLKTMSRRIIAEELSPLTSTNYILQAL